MWLSITVVIASNHVRFRADPTGEVLMNTDSKLMEMLTGYAASHQHPFNVFVHMIGIPTIMFGVLIPLTWVRIDLPFMSFNLAHVMLVAFVAFYLTLDVLFAVVFAVIGALLLTLAVLVLSPVFGKHQITPPKRY